MSACTQQSLNVGKMQTVKAGGILTDKRQLRPISITKYATCEVIPISVGQVAMPGNNNLKRKCELKLVGRIC